MADNIDVTPGTGATVAADDVGGALHQRVKLSLGANGTAVDAGAGAGTVGTDTQRVTLASDDPAVVAMQLLDDTVAVLGTATYTEATTKGLVVAAVRRDADTTLVDTTNEVGPLQMDANGRLKVEAFSGETLPVSSVAVLVDDAAFTPATSSVMMSGFQADESSTDSVDEGDAGAARMTLDRKQIVTVQPHTAGGLSVFRSLDLDESEEEVKGSAGCLYKLRLTNRASTARYVKLYNDTAANVTVGTTTPIDTIVVPGASSADLATVLTENFGGYGLTFSAALCLAATTGLADNDTGAPGANDVVATAYYK